MILLNSLDQWLTYFGHFHPVIVHLPIGILLLALIIELFSRKVAAMAVSFMLAAGCTTAIVSCILGWLLSKQGNYDERTLLLHQWMGIGVAVIAGICWWIKSKQRSTAKMKRVYVSLLSVMFIALVITGHNGGSMTHGDEYLTAELPEWFDTNNTNDTSVFVKKSITNIDEAYVYKDVVQNVLGEKCFSCHSAKKVKGGLRVDDEKLLFKGGKHGVVIRPGNAHESELIKRILLPEDDDKRMPPRKQEQLTREEIELLKWWIQNGADTKKKTKDFNPASGLMPMLASFTQPAQKDSATITPLSPIFDAALPPANQPTIDTLTGLGILVLPVAKNKNLFEISCINYPAFNDQTTLLLLSMAEHIVSLKIDGTNVTDNAFNSIGKFRNLVHLNFANTNVTGAIVTKIKMLKGLEYINLVGTKIDDEGLLQLRTLPALKRVYCWNSQVTERGLAAFNQKKIIAIGEE